MYCSWNFVQQTKGSFNFSTYNPRSKNLKKKNENEKSEVKNNKWKNSWELHRYAYKIAPQQIVIYTFSQSSFLLVQEGPPLHFKLKKSQRKSFSKSELLIFQELSARIQKLDFQEVLLLVWFLQSPSLASNLKYHRLRMECCKKIVPKQLVVSHKLQKSLIWRKGWILDHFKPWNHKPS